MSHARLDGVNPHFRSRFATLASVIDATRPALSRHGIAVVQLPGYSEGRVTVTTRLMWGDESVECTAETRPKKDDPQAMGSAYTYLRRYSLAAICGIAAEDDDDGNHASSARSAPASPNRSGTPSQAAAAAGAPRHHDSFTAHARRKFMAELGELGVKYDDAAKATEAAGWGRPSAWKPTQRAGFLSDLAAAGSVEALIKSKQEG
jgi:hypothetical protein